MIFKDIDINSKSKLEEYFKLIECESSEQNFTNLYMWQNSYNSRYYMEEDFAVIIENYKDGALSIIPLARKDKMYKAIDFILNYLRKEDKKIYLRNISKEVVSYMQYKYENEFKYIEDRDNFDYVYDANDLRTLHGRKYRKRRNHINIFLKEYDGLYKYKSLNKENIYECLDLMKFWMNDKELKHKFQFDMEDEFLAIKNIFLAYDDLKLNIKIGGIYIDSKLEAFTIGEKLNNNTALIHIEKANPSIRGLYAFINQQFLLNEFYDVKFVNREEDLGIEGLREAKLTYHPCRFVEKYFVIDKKLL